MGQKKIHRARFGILLIVIGVLWLAQRAGWFPSEVFGPIVLLTLGLWMTATSYSHKWQAPRQGPTNNEGSANRNEE